uniref:Uncharacterized protein n=1 Tax=viral metagenome TaxID=1070528 RepID=A0A6C0LB61_9ZZZZ
MSVAPIIINTTKNNEELATLITSILKGLGTPNKTESTIKGGAPDDGLAKLIVSVLKALSNKDGAGADIGAGAGAGAGYFFGSKKPGDPNDLLINDILDIILNIANGVEIPKPEINLKDKMLSGLGSLKDKFGSMFKGVKPTNVVEEEQVPVFNKECKLPNQKGEPDPIAMIDNECIGSQGTPSEKNK